MTDARLRRGGEVLAAAALLGLLGDLLLRAMPLGLNGAIGLGVGAAAIAVLGRRQGAGWTSRALRPVAPLIVIALLLLWRDAGALTALALLLIAVAVVAGFVSGAPLRLASFGAWLVAALSAPASALVEMAPLLSRDLPGEGVRQRPWARYTLATGRGFLVAAPLLLIFGGLFAAADAVFGRSLARLFAAPFENAFGHLIGTLGLTWLAGGYLRGLFAARPLLLLPAPVTRPRLGRIELVIILGSLALLFLAFVAVQFRYFFGGEGPVLADTGLTYAEYARRGFFELVTVTALALPLLLALHWLVGEERPTDRRLFRLLSGLLLLLLAVVMASALQRMRLYLRAYGLTELRLYATVFILWLGALGGWFVLTVLRGQRDRFLFGALVSGALVVLALFAVNPDRLIVRTNLDRAAAGTPFDARYAATRSADAVPALLASLPTLTPTDRCLVARELLARWGTSDGPDWRTWNWSRQRARAAVADQRAELAATQPCTTR